MVAYTYRMPAGIPGTVNRTETATVEAQFYDTTLYFPAFGLPGKISAAGKFVPIAAGDTAASVYGFNLRPYPTQSNTAAPALGTSTPPMDGKAGEVLKRGYVLVKLNGTTAAAKNGAVYIRTAVGANGAPVGGVEAAADGSNTFVLPSSSYFTGPADANGNIEIAFNI